MSIVGKIQRNLRLLVRPAVLSSLAVVDKNYKFVLRTFEGKVTYEQTAGDVAEASILLAKRLHTSVVELSTVTVAVYENGRLIWSESKSSPAVESLEPLRALFNLQDSLIEHKFPHEKAQIVDNRISDAGDIFREMTGASDFAYVMEKWNRLIAAVHTPPLSTLQAGDWEEIKENTQLPIYREQRDQFLANLRRLKDETLRTPMDSKRRDLMVASLNMIEGLVFWFESMDPYNPPRMVMERLTDTVANYFPQFWEE